MVSPRRASSGRAAAGKGSRPALGFWLEYASLPACEIAAGLGYDVVIFDLEHGVIPPAVADELTLVCKRLGLTVYARVAAAERVAIQHALDSGADGVILPQIAGLEHARDVTAYAKYPPLGTRGVGYSRTMNYGSVPRNFYAAENRRTLCLPMIETPGALDDVVAIAGLDTVDGLFIGPSDLSMTRKRGPFAAARADLKDLGAIALAARKAGKIWGMPAPGRKIFDFARREGAAFVTVCDDLTALGAGFAQGLAVAGRR
ncbi:MAG TPA: aldolase/citrate lyase family protein [Candidatus Udaeobacter sp.]|nr:aldolase/citrate lyase family protein [Candidatus Udaeobacter sp.]